MFADASHVEWGREFTAYKADFYSDGHEKEAWFTPDGQWKITKTEISILEVSEAVLKTAHEWSDWEIDDVAFYEQAEGVTSFYLIEYDNEISGKEKQLRVFPSGAIMTDF